jgi:hypothetical protein
MSPYLPLLPSLLRRGRGRCSFITSVGAGLAPPSLSFQRTCIAIPFTGLQGRFYLKEMEIVYSTSFPKKKIINLPIGFLYVVIPACPESLLRRTPDKRE